MATPFMQTSMMVPRAKLLAPMLFGSATVMLIAWGFMRRTDVELSAETGVGYALGIVGVSCMLLLLLYPLAKRARWLQQVVPIRHWFRIHMMLGVLGPVAILFHSNFSLGSMNSNVALVCMLVVVFSGLVGRYFYAKVHLGLYGQKATSKQLLRVAFNQREGLRDRSVQYPALLKELESIYSSMLPADPERISFFGTVLASPRYWYHRLRVGRLMRKHGIHASSDWKDAQQTLRAYLDTLRKLAQLQLFERLLAWWHVLHLPFFFMMVMSGVIHVWAVHVY